MSAALSTICSQVIFSIWNPVLGYNVLCSNITVQCYHQLMTHIAPSALPSQVISLVILEPPVSLLLNDLVLVTII